MKKLVIAFVLLLIPLATAISECQREIHPNNVPCLIISSWKPSGICSDYNISIYNETGINILNLTWGDYNPFCNATFNISKIGVYHYNSTIEDGVINVKGDDEGMIWVIGVFLLGINLVVFLLPFFVKFSVSEAASYVVRRLLWIGALALLWFNTTLFRQLASDWGLGIDNFLIVYWWLFTLGIFAGILIMCYVMVVGSVKLMKEAQIKKRMGEDGY